MFPAFTETKAIRTSLRSIFGTDVFHLDPRTCCLILHKLPQLIKRPTVQPGSKLFACFDPFADVLQIFHYNSGTTVSLSLQNDLLGNAVIDGFNMPFFSAGDIPQLLFSRLRTVALKTPSHCQKSISLSSKRPSSEQFTCGGCGQDTFSQIHAHCLASFHWQNIRQVENKVKKPSFPFAYKLSFFGFAAIEKTLVISADFKGYADPSAQCKQREHSIFQRIGPLIKMDRTPLFKKQLFGALKGFQTSCCFGDHITAHLRAKFWQRAPQRAITEVMEADAISLFSQKSNSCNFITALCEQILQLAKSFSLHFRYGKLNCNGPFHKEKFILHRCFNTIFRERQFLPALKGWVSLPSIG